MAGIAIFLRGCDETDYLRRFITEYLIAMWNSTRGDDRITGANLLNIAIHSPSHSPGSDEDYVGLFVCVIATAFIRIVVDDMYFTVIEHDPFSVALARDELAVIGDISSILFP